MSTRTSTARAEHQELRISELHGSLDDPALRSMDFLNEVAESYPTAISLAAGRPSEQFFDVDSVGEHLQTFQQYLADVRGFDHARITRTLFQYGAASGVINDVVAKHLSIDEGIEVEPADLVVTVGCQEAIFLVARALRTDDRDVLLAVAPTYVGLTGAARLVDMPVIPVAGGPRGVDLDDLVSTVRRCRREGNRPRACYVMPDFANPAAASMDLDTRTDLLRMAEDEDILLLEDNPYGHFHGGGARLPVLKAMDGERRVIYFGSFAKTVMPGARVGYVVADQTVVNSQGKHAPLARHLASVKSMLTVNTSPVAQGVVAGKLVSHGFSLAAANERERSFYQDNLRLVLSRLDERLSEHNPQVSWNTPSGGFFVVLTVPFVADDAELVRCAEEFGVLWTPMSHFYDSRGGERQLRISCSGVSVPDLTDGLDRLCRYVSTRVNS
ncbi:PLP-dependent aminotransferase family protein [Lentzea sp. NPDC034063]|uniref:aminotransferase-like domain-containing protein n=1 Tax=unclassified Lentzea TaxID=2643253 RepID=UPI0033C4E91B